MREDYINRDNPAYDAILAQRSAGREAAFFVPHLRPGMRLLDCGCGPGAITLGLAEVVAPGEVVGIDIDPNAVEAATSLAARRGTAQVRFEMASIYELPFPDASFDAVFAHTVLVHLKEPQRALREMHRVLCPGGVAGIADGDWGARLLAPPLPLVEALCDLEVRVRRHNGGDPFLARRYRELLLDAGFARAEAGSTVYSAGSQEECRRYAAATTGRFAGPAIVETIISQGWADHASLDEMLVALHAWGERPDAFYAIVTCNATGWKG